MTNNLSTHYTLICRVISKITPPNSHRRIRYNLLLLPFAVVAFVAVTALSSCDKEALPPPLDDMEYMYQESRGLTGVSSDSVQRFAAKFQSYVNRNPECQKNPDYYDIVANIQNAANSYGLVITITINTAWEGDTTIYY